MFPTMAYYESNHINLQTMSCFAGEMLLFKGEWLAFNYNLPAYLQRWMVKKYLKIGSSINHRSTVVS